MWAVGRILMASLQTQWPRYGDQRSALFIVENLRDEKPINIPLTFAGNSAGFLHQAQYRTF